MDTGPYNRIFTCFKSIGCCCLISATYLLSFHIWRSSYSRDHPITIKKRFFSVFVMLFIAPLIMYQGLDESLLEKTSFFDIVGVKTKGLIQAILLPLFLTILLFIGPISLDFYNEYSRLYKEPECGSFNVTDLRWWRNHVVAPFSEEFTFRSCMLPLLLQCLSPFAAILINPLFFGVAHFHHMQERMRAGMDFESALQMSCFQFFYTTIFGAYSAYVFYRTGHFVAIFVIHAFCNHMGFPDFREVNNCKTSQKIIISCLFVLGLISWSLLLKPLTEPDWYHNSPTWYKVY